MMTKRLLLLTTLSLFSISTFAQDSKKETETIKTKMGVFESKTGTITKFTDTKLSKLQTTYATAETRIRKITSGAVNGYFFQIIKEGKYGPSVASIEYSDLVEVVKALKVLKSEINNDITSNPDNLENRFTTVDGLQIGYFISGGKTNWFLKLERSGSDNTLFLNDSTTLESSFNEAKNKIEELKK